MPLDIIEKMDKQRGDIPRSRFILRMIENNLMIMEKPQSPQVSRPIETEALDIASTPAKGVETRRQ